ncbi:hypothetical protein GCM10009557_94320 [Virgisporangium ochraceum]
MPGPATSGAVHWTVAVPAPGVATTAVGAPGGPGVTPVAVTVGTDGPVSPTPTATTENVYAVVFDSPVTVQVISAVVPDAPPGDAVTT